MPALQPLPLCVPPLEVLAGMDPPFTPLRTDPPICWESPAAIPYLLDSDRIRELADKGCCMVGYTRDIEAWEPRVVFARFRLGPHNQQVIGVVPAADGEPAGSYPWIDLVVSPWQAAGRRVARHGELCLDNEFVPWVALEDWSMLQPSLAVLGYRPDVELRVKWRAVRQAVAKLMPPELRVDYLHRLDDENLEWYRRLLDSEDGEDGN
jgi:hypothetical protein